MSQYRTQPVSIQPGEVGYSFGSTNLRAPSGPPAPASPVLAGSTANANATVSGTVYVQVAYVFPGDNPSQLNPLTNPVGFASAANSFAMGSNTSITVTSPAQDVNGIAIGYDVFAGPNASFVNLMNTNLAIPIGTNYTISNQLSLTGAAVNPASTTITSKTNTENGATIPANGTVGNVFAVSPQGYGVPTAGPRDVMWSNKYPAGGPSTANIWLQGALDDVSSANSFVTLDYTTSTANVEIRNVLTNCKFLRTVANATTGNSGLTMISKIVVQ